MLLIIPLFFRFPDHVIRLPCLAFGGNINHMASLKVTLPAPGEVDKRRGCYFATDWAAATGAAFDHDKGNSLSNDIELMDGTVQYAVPVWTRMVCGREVRAIGADGTTFNENPGSHKIAVAPLFQNPEAGGLEIAILDNDGNMVTDFNNGDKPERGFLTINGKFATYPHDRVTGEAYIHLNNALAGKGGVVTLDKVGEVTSNGYLGFGETVPFEDHKNPVYKMQFGANKSGFGGVAGLGLDADKREYTWLEIANVEGDSVRFRDQSRVSQQDPYWFENGKIPVFRRPDGSIQCSEALAVVQFEESEAFRAMGFGYRDEEPDLGRLNVGKFLNGAFLTEIYRSVGEVRTADTEIEKEKAVKLGKFRPGDRAFIKCEGRECVVRAIDKHTQVADVRVDGQSLKYRLEDLEEIK